MLCLVVNLDTVLVNEIDHNLSNLSLLWVNLLNSNVFFGILKITKCLTQVISEPSSSPILPRTMYNPSGLYSAEGAEGMEESVAKFQHPFIPTKAFTAFNKEKKMVELGTLTVEAKQKLKTFPRFMAVP